MQFPLSTLILNFNESNKMKKPVLYLFVFIVAFSCKEKFVPSLQSPATGYLVVEGFISNGSQPTTVTISRSVKLYDTATVKYEHNANARIESSNQEVYPLSETGNGVYSASPVVLNNAEKYRLHITTQDGREYVSDFETVKNTPPIDSLSWKRENGGVTIYVSTHSNAATHGYYRWDYEETWEFHSAFGSSLAYFSDPVTNFLLGVGYRTSDHGIDSSIFRCWKSLTSTDIHIASSEKLTSDVIYQPLLHIAEGQQRLSLLYSINVKQYSLTPESYAFYQGLKQNTENLGSIFDPLPTSLPSNIHCITDPSEVAVGYIDISTEQSQRIFISNASVPGWNYNPECPLVILDNNPDSLQKYGYGTLPIGPKTTVQLAIKDFYASDPDCVDCTLTGSNKRPPFWP